MLGFSIFGKKRILIIIILSSEFKADETFDYGGLEKDIYKAVSSSGINMKSMADSKPSVSIEFLIPLIEFSAV